KHGLIVTVGKTEKFIVIDLYNEWNPMCKFSAHDSQDTISGSNGIASAFDCQANNIFRIEINWIGSKRSACTMFNSLVHRKDAAITRTTQSSMIQKTLKIAQDLVAAVAVDPNLFNMI